MPTPEDYALAAASSANDALLSALLATAKAVLTNEDEVAAAQWAADAYTYMLNSRGNVTYVTFDGIINAGSSSVPIGKVQLRRDLAGSWTVSNPILSIGELGIETDTKFIKIGDGSSHWVDLPYMGSTKAAVGLGNVSNLAPIDYPVSTAQTTADTAILNASKAYTDLANTGHLIDVGDYSVSLSNAYPIIGGTGIDGLILKGNTFNVIGSGTINSTIINEGYSLRALVDDPSQLDTDWLVTINPISTNNPYIVVLNIPSLVINNYTYPYHLFTISVTFAINFALSKAQSKIYATSNFIFNILKNGISIGTITFLAGTTIGVFAVTTLTTFTAGDSLEIKSQANPDNTLSDISISLLGSRI